MPPAERTARAFPDFQGAGDALAVVGVDAVSYTHLLILENLARFLDETGKPVHVRLPLVTGLNDDAAHLEPCLLYTSRCV